MEKEEKSHIIQLPNTTKWPKESAGSHMTTKVPVIDSETTLGTINRLVFNNITKFDAINYIYVVNKKGVLTGVLSMKEVFRRQGSSKVGKASKKVTVYVHPETDQERVIYLALRNNIKAIPIVDKEGVLLGVVPSDKILSILYHEAREDALHIAGIHKKEEQFDDILETPLITSYRYRVPWLILGMFGGLFAARIVGLFQTTLEQNLLLAAFIPLMVYISNAVAVQGQTILVRDISASDKIPYVKYIIRQGGVSFLIAITLSVLFFIISRLGFTLSFFVGFVAALAMLVSINVATFLGMLVPIILKRLKIDPALGSGPLSTILQDTMTIIIYFGVASVML